MPAGDIDDEDDSDFLVLPARRRVSGLGDAGLDRPIERRRFAGAGRGDRMAAFARSKHVRCAGRVVVRRAVPELPEVVNVQPNRRAFRSLGIRRVARPAVPCAARHARSANGPRQPLRSCGRIGRRCRERVPHTARECKGRHVNPPARRDATAGRPRRRRGRHRRLRIGGRDGCTPARETGLERRPKRGSVRARTGECRKLLVAAVLPSAADQDSRRQRHLRSRQRHVCG